MRRCRLLVIFSLAVVVMAATGALTMTSNADTISSATLPDTDMRAHVPPVNLDTHRNLSVPKSLAEWEARRASIRQQVLVSCGLAPLPPKTPLKAKIFGKIERDGYSIEKVYFQTYPGFYLAGNLYRPSKSLHAGSSDPSHPGILVAHGHKDGGGKSPGILISHGHWEVGRMANTPDGSIPARAITFARQGCVAFTYDMVGYNDTRQIPQHRTFGADNNHWLWSVSLMGLQTWNSVRALDFLSSLPDVDKSRLAITGESGGGTQTMMLGAIDDRLAAVGPCVMVSHTMQGGCLCENAPLLRVDYFNMEIAAAAAPKPQIMVGAAGDWTTTMMTVEGPGVESIYKLYGKSDQLKYVRFNYNHNINKTSREAIYKFFGKWLLHDENEIDFNEPPYGMEPVKDLMVFPEGTSLPSDAKTSDELTNDLIRQAKLDLEHYKPVDKRSLSLFKKTYSPIWTHTLLIEQPQAGDLLHHQGSASKTADYSVTTLNIGRSGRGDNIPAILFTPAKPNGTGVVLAGPAGKSAFLDADSGQPGLLVRDLLSIGQTVLLPDCFLTGQRSDPKAQAARKRPFGEFFTTYNRTDMQERVQDLITCCAYLRSVSKLKSITLVGLHRAGLWALLAAPAADRVAADCDRFDLTTDDMLLADDMYVPGLRRLGDFGTAATLAAPHPLLLFNTGKKFSVAAWISSVYSSIGASASLQTESGKMSESKLVDWIAK